MSQKDLMPLVSVVIPCYNAGVYIADTISSVLAQTYPAVEIIVVDDGSKDNSAEIIKSIRQTAPINITYIYQDNAGVSVARNVGIRASKGSYIVPLDSDDILKPENIKEKVSLALSKNASLVIADVEVVNENLQFQFIAHCAPSSSFPSCLFNFAPPSIISPSSTLIKKEIFDIVGFFDEELSVSADLDMWIRISNVAFVAKVDKVLTQYRLVPGSMNTNISRQISDMKKIFRKIETNKKYNRLLHNLKSQYCYSLAGTGWKNKNFYLLLKYGFSYLFEKIKFVR